MVTPEARSHIRKLSIIAVTGWGSSSIAHFFPHPWSWWDVLPVLNFTLAVAYAWVIRDEMRNRPRG